MVEFFAKMVEKGGAAVTAYPEIFWGMLGLGLCLGWSAAWIILRNRLTHHKELLEHYENVITEKIPGTVLRRQTNRSFASLWILGIIVIIVMISSVYYIGSIISASYGRHLTEGQQRIVTEKLKSPDHYGITISVEAGCVDCSQYGADFEAAFKDAGWRIVGHGMLIGPLERPPSGLRLIARGPDAEIDLIKNALRAANVEFDVIQAQGGPATSERLSYPELFIVLRLRH